MGSSILASLSEAGGNDPFHHLNGPLPPHSISGADRVERDPRGSLCKRIADSGGFEVALWAGFSAI